MAKGVYTPQDRAARSARLKARWQDPAWRAKALLRLAQFTTNLVNDSKTQSRRARQYWSRPESHAEHSARMKVHANSELGRSTRAMGAQKRWAQPDSRRRQSETMKASWRNDADRRHAQAAIGMAALQHRKRYPYLDRRGRLYHFRSGETYELGVARWLDAQALTWEYEAHQLLLSDGRVYWPDFWVHEWGRYLEVKGRGGRWGRAKAELAQHDGHPVVIIVSIKELETCPR